MTSSPGTPSDQLVYDVFISYRHQEPDRRWVRPVLLTRLEETGLRVCIDYWDFGLARPLIDEMERAVEESRYTVAVLSPAYMTGNFAKLERILAMHLGLGNRHRRLIAVMRAPVEPNLTIGSHLWLDMTDDGEFETAQARLIETLKQPSGA